MENSVAIVKLQNQMRAYLACITATSFRPKEDQLFVFPAKLTADFVDCNTKVLQSTESQNISDHDMDICDDKFMVVETERNIIDLYRVTMPEK